MAHELTIRASGRAEMAFVGETPWHGLGQNVTKGASIGVWQKEAGMDWTAEESRVSFHPVVKGTKATGSLVVGGYKAIYRSDTRDPLSIVGQGYQVVQPKDVLEFFRDLTEVGGWHIHTAGTLRGGRKLWAMASHHEQDDVGKGDRIHNNLLLATSLDGSMKTTAMLTAVRVVCANTLAIALHAPGSENERAVKVSHRSVFDPSGIKRALGVAADSFEVFMQQARELADTPMALDQAREIIASVFVSQSQSRAVDTSWMGDLASFKAGDPDQEEPKDSRSVGRILDLFQGEGMGSQLATSRNTAWGLLNAVTQFVDHEMGRTDDTRLDGAWFGRGQQFKQQAMSSLLAIV